MYTAFQLLDKINSHISDIQFTRTPAGLYDPIKYVLSMGGKRIRPVLMLMAYNLYKEDVSSIYDPATAIEVYGDRSADSFGHPDEAEYSYLWRTCQSTG